MKSLWKVASKNNGGVEQYAVYRLLDAKKPVSGDNMEFGTDYLDSCNTTHIIANLMNALPNARITPVSSNFNENLIY